MLAETTGNQSYVKRSRESEQFYSNHLRNTRGDILDGINLTTCVRDNGIYPASPGLMTEGISVLLSVLKDDSDRAKVLQDLMEVINKMMSDSRWHNADGILEVASEYSRNGELVEYLGAQYNAVLSNARGQGNSSNLYGASWTAPSSASNFSLQSQTNALSVLLAGIALGNDSDTPPSAPTGGVGGSEPRQTSSPNVGVIVGGAVGGVVTAGLFTLFVVLWFVRRNRRRKQDLDAIEERSGNNAVYQIVQPFTFTAEENRTEAKDGRGKISSNKTPGDREPAEDFAQATIDAGHVINTDATSPQGSYSSESVIPTADLIRLLNRRLQGIEWRGDEQPPDYVSQG
ncbi:hypothetical protein PM082_003863 [Marasmius tenuissimus]|nr:hypothetical protein PM082_003863 [Marasmius tenuissimus]